MDTNAAAQRFDLNFGLQEKGIVMHESFKQIVSLPGSMKEQYMQGVLPVHNLCM
jgi:hypothetical protein